MLPLRLIGPVCKFGDQVKNATSRPCTFPVVGCLCCRNAFKPDPGLRVLVVHQEYKNRRILLEWQRLPRLTELSKIRQPYTTLVTFKDSQPRNTRRNDMCVILSNAGEGNFSSTLHGSSIWSKTQIDMRQISRRKSHLVMYVCMYVWGLYTDMRFQRWSGTVKHICLPELRRGW